MLACFARGSGLDGRGCKRQRMRIQHDGRKSYLAHPSAGEFPVFRAPDVPPSRVSGPRSPASFGRLFRTMATFSPRFAPFVRAEEEEQVSAQLAVFKDKMASR